MGVVKMSYTDWAGFQKDLSNAQTSKFNENILPFKKLGFSHFKSRDISLVIAATVQFKWNSNQIHRKFMENSNYFSV